MKNITKTTILLAMITSSSYEFASSALTSSALKTARSMQPTITNAIGSTASQYSTALNPNQASSTYSYKGFKNNQSNYTPQNRSFMSYVYKNWFTKQVDPSNVFVPNFNESYNANDAQMESDTIDRNTYRQTAVNILNKMPNPQTMTRDSIQNEIDIIAKTNPSRPSARSSNDAKIDFIVRTNRFRFLNDQLKTLGN